MKLPFALLALALLCVEISSLKTEWPEVVGQTGQDAKAQILADRPDVTVYILPEGSFVTMDYRTNRVRVFINGAGNVASPPRIG
jgi:hypothetical protein